MEINTENQSVSSGDTVPTDNDSFTPTGSVSGNNSIMLTEVDNALLEDMVLLMEKNNKLLTTLTEHTEGESALSKDVMELLEENNELLTELDAYTDIRQETELHTLWDKPLEEYTVSESFSLIGIIVIVGFAIFRFIGGIVTCEK